MDAQTAKQFNYLLAGFVAGWALIFGYLFWIAQKERILRKKVSELQDAVEERWKQKKA
jgi:CcmD family protein